MEYSRTAREVFDDWARDYHADGMEQGHRKAVELALKTIEPSSGHCLEIGVGNGYAIRQLATQAFAGGQCHGLDLSPHMAERARERNRDLVNVTIRSGDFLETRFDPALHFSLIFSMEVFYYFPGIQQGIQRAYDLLEPGGNLMVLVNYYREHAASHEWPAQLDTPMQLWSVEDYRTGFDRAGFSGVQQQQLNARPAEGDTPANPGTLATWGRK